MKYSFSQQVFDDPSDGIGRNRCYREFMLRNGIEKDLSMEQDFAPTGKGSARV
jgi:hypothetical protein